MNRLFAILVASILGATLIPQAPAASAPLALGASLEKTVVAPGESLSGSVTIKNEGGTSLTLERVVLASRPPGGTNAAGPYKDFGTAWNVRLAPGESKTFTFTRTFALSDPEGNWYAYPAIRRADGGWQDGERVDFTVAENRGVSLAASLSGSSVAPGGKLSGIVTLKNEGGEEVTLKRAVLAGRPPGGTNQGGPYKDFGAAWNVRLAPGETRAFTFSRTFAQDDPQGAWYAYPTLEHADGRWQDGERVDFTVAKAPSPAAFEVTAALARGSVQQGESLEGSVTVKNVGGSSATLPRVVLAARPPGGTNEKGPYADFGTTRDVTLAPGESRTLTFTRAFSSKDPTGGWYAYGTLQRPDGSWQDGSRVDFTVEAPTEPTLPAAFEVSASLDATTVTRGQSLGGTVTVKNTGGTSATVPHVYLAARPPGGTNDGGPYKDFGVADNVPLAPGESRSFRFSRAFTAEDPTGSWWAYGSIQRPDGSWQEGRRIDFRVEAATPPGPTPPPSSSGPSVVKATANGLTVNGREFLVKGIAYAPVPIGHAAGDGTDWYEMPHVYKADLPRIKAMGANTLRVYHIPIWNPPVAKAFLDEAHKNGLMVIVGDWSIGDWADAADPKTRGDAKWRALEIVRLFKDHPAVLMWMVGNEVDGKYAGKNLADWYGLLDEIAVETHKIDPNHPVSTAHTAGEQFRYFPWAAPNVDVYSVNLYALAPGGISDWFLPLAKSKLPGKSVLFSEFGSDAWDTWKSREYEDVQANLIDRQWRQIESGHWGGSRQSAGGVVFEWVDEWYKSGEPSKHNGAADWTSNDAKAHLPDQAFSEEYWGIARQAPGSTDRSYRQAYWTLKGLWGG